MEILPLLSPLLDQTVYSDSGKMKYIDQTFSGGSPSTPTNELRSEMNISEAYVGDRHNTTTDSTSNVSTFKALLETLSGRMQLMEENIGFLRTEVEHKNSTIENLFNVIRKLMPCAEGDTTYNNDVDAYNENVSKFNSTPMKKDNITVRKKTAIPQKDLSEYDFDQPCCEESASLASAEENCEPVVPIEHQLTDYRNVKHSNFLATKKGMSWDGMTWKKTETTMNNDSLMEVASPNEAQLDDAGTTNDDSAKDISVHDVPLDDDQDIKRMDDLYEDWEEASISSEGGSLSQLLRIYKGPLPPEALWRKGTTLIIGDSMLGGIDETRLRDTKVRVKPVASIEDMFFQITPYLRKNPTNIICHVGTNNAKYDGSNEIMEKLVKLKEYIVSLCPSAKVVFSSLIVRTDDVNAAREVKETNSKLKHLDTPLVDNSNITKDHLGRKGLHMNYVGTRMLASNLIIMLRAFGT